MQGFWIREIESHPNRTPVIKFKVSLDKALPHVKNRENWRRLIAKRAIHPLNIQGKGKVGMENSDTNTASVWRNRAFFSKALLAWAFFVTSHDSEATWQFSPTQSSYTTNYTAISSGYYGSKQWYSEANGSIIASVGAGGVSAEVDLWASASVELYATTNSDSVGVSSLSTAYSYAYWVWVGAPGASPSRTADLDLEMYGYVRAAGRGSSRYGSTTSSGTAHADGYAMAAADSFSGSGWGWAEVAGSHNSTTQAAGAGLNFLGSVIAEGDYYDWEAEEQESFWEVESYYTIWFDGTYTTTAGAPNIYAEAGGYVDALVYISATVSQQSESTKSNAYADAWGYASVAF